MTVQDSIEDALSAHELASAMAKRNISLVPKTQIEPELDERPEVRMWFVGQRLLQSFIGSRHPFQVNP